MKLFTRIFLLVVTTSLVFNVVVNACEKKERIELRTSAEEDTEDEVDTAIEFPLVTSLLRF